jgi:serine/threonine-protein phosphatase 5
MSLADIRNINRLDPDTKDEFLINNLIWSDPVENSGVAPSHRGLGFLFGPDVTNDFLIHNNLSLIIRSHQYKEMGYSEQHDDQCVTIFSCPNYR